MQYRPTAVPTNLLELPAYLERELRNIAAALSTAEPVVVAPAVFRDVSQLPDKVTGGEVARVGDELMLYNADASPGRWEALVGADTLLEVFAFAAYGQMMLTAPPAAFPNLGATWQHLTVFDGLTVTPRGVTLDPATDTFTFEHPGAYALALTGSFAHDSSNQGRSTQIRFYNVTDAAGGGAFPVGIGRNVEDTAFAIVGLMDIAAGDEGDTFRVEIGNGSTVSTVSFSALSLAVWNVGEWRGALG